MIPRKTIFLSTLEAWASFSYLPNTMFARISELEVYIKPFGAFLPIETTIKLSSPKKPWPKMKRVFSRIRKHMRTKIIISGFAMKGQIWFIFQIIHYGNLHLWRKTDRLTHEYHMWQYQKLQQVNLHYFVEDTHTQFVCIKKLWPLSIWTIGIYIDGLYL